MMVGEKRNPWLDQLIRFPFYVLALFVLLPYYWMATAAFKPLSEIQARPPSFLIKEPSFHNFFDSRWKFGEVSTLQDVTQGLFQRYEVGYLGQIFVNSLGITFFVTLFSLLLASAAAYVLVKHKFWGANLIFGLIIASMMVPWEVTIIPNFLTIRDLGWINSYQALLIPGLAKAFTVFFFRQVIMNMPNDLFEAAKIDGANEFRIWWQIVLPLLRPALAAMVIFVSLAEWNNFMWPLIVVNDAHHMTLPLQLSQLAGDLSKDPRSAGVVMAATLLVSLPALIIFMLFQKDFINGLTAGSVKG